MIDESRKRLEGRGVRSARCAFEVASLWGMKLESREVSSRPCAGISGYNRKTGPGTESGVTAFSFVITCSKDRRSDFIVHTSLLKGSLRRPTSLLIPQRTEGPTSSLTARIPKRPRRFRSPRRNRHRHGLQ